MNNKNDTSETTNVSPVEGQPVWHCGCCFDKSGRHGMHTLMTLQESFLWGHKQLPESFWVFMLHLVLGSPQQWPWTTGVEGLVISAQFRFFCGQSLLWNSLLGGGVIFYLQQSGSSLSSPASPPLPLQPFIPSLSRLWVWCPLHCSLKASCFLFCLASFFYYSEVISPNKTLGLLTPLQPLLLRDPK